MLRILEILPPSIAALALVACADVNSVVGGGCAQGYVEQDNACVLATASTSPDAGDGGALAQDDGGGQTRDAGSSGDGGTSWATGVGPTPVKYCTSPYLRCNDGCIDPMTDPNDCGACGKVCPSNACVAGKCTGSAPGHVVVIGHDYATAPSTFSSQARVLANATLMPASNPLRVMSYEEYADATAVKNAESLVSAEAKQLGRSVTFVPVGSAQTVSSTLDETTYDVLLVHDQSGAPSGELASIGSSWKTDGHVAAFLSAGGVVVVLTGGAGTAEMPDLATNAGLLDISSETSVKGSLTVLAPADAVGSGVVSPYVPKPSTVSFDTEANGGDVVWVVARNGVPVVVHKVMP
jgi:hypothetical protein